MVLSKLFQWISDTKHNMEKHENVTKSNGFILNFFQIFHVVQAEHKFEILVTVKRRIE